MTALHQINTMNITVGILKSSNIDEQREILQSLISARRIIQNTYQSFRGKSNS